MKKLLFFKKTIAAAILTHLFHFSAFAKVSDFNKLLDENESTQADLHQSIRINLKSVRSIPKKRERIVMSDDFQNTIVSPSKPLKYKKEILKMKKPSPTKSVERIGTELRQIDQL